MAKTEERGVAARMVAPGGVDKQVEILPDGKVKGVRSVPEGAYFTDVVGGFLPEGLPTSEAAPGAVGEADGDPGHEDPLYVRVDAAPEGEAGDVAGTLPEVRPDLQGQRSEDRPRPEKYAESAPLGKAGKK